jgi:hypothetical protein
MQRAKAEARTAKILRRFAIGLALVLLLAISAAVVAYSQSQEAGRQSQEASNQRATALAEGTRAAEANGTAVAAAADVQTVQSSTLEELQAQATQDVLDLLIIASESETEVDELRAIAATAAAAAVATQTAVANQTIAAATATAAAATAEANATATALAACVNDVTVESRTLKLRSGTEIASILTNADFTYEVVLRNSGTCTWEDGLQWVYVDGEAFGYEGDGETINTPVLPEETYPINLDLRSPDSQDTFRSSWQLVDAEGNPIGNPLNFSIVVALPPTATPAATATSSVVVTDLTFADEVLAATCEYQGIDWSCLVRITPYGGAGGPYTVLVEDQPGGQFTQLSGSSPYTYNARARRCANFSQNVRVIDNGASPPIIDSSPLYIRPDDYFPGGCTE